MYRLYSYLVVVFFLNISLISAQESFSRNEHEELGKVNWYRNYNEALLVAKKEKKPVLILFQEVPGCATCRNYGHNVLSHPLMVEAIENYFIPVAIFNNRGGKDKIVLKKYNEPSWNNPVVRIINGNEEEITPRIGGDYEALTLSKRMKQALIKNNTPIPEFLNLLELELSSAQLNTTEETHFKMYCFWTGEKELGKLEGVLSTQSGFMDHSEVVKVKYNKKVLSKETLLSTARKNNFYLISKSNYRLAKNDLHYYLKHSKYSYIPLTELQKTKINSALGSGKSAQKYLSPKQKKWFNNLDNPHNKTSYIASTNFVENWFKKEKHVSISN